MYFAFLGGICTRLWLQQGVCHSIWSMTVPWHKVTQQNDGAWAPRKRGLGTWNKIKNLDSLYSLRSARSAKAATGLLMLVLTQWHNFRISGHSCRVLWFFSLIGMLVVKAQVKSHRSLSFLFSIERVNMSALLTHDSGSMNLFLRISTTQKRLKLQPSFAGMLLWRSLGRCYQQEEDDKTIGIPILVRMCKSVCRS